MNIAIENNILLLDRAGSAGYAKELINNLLKIDKQNIYRFYSYGSGNSGNFIKGKAENLIRDILWMQLGLPGAVKKDKIDILHCTAFKAPLNLTVPLVVTFFDLHILKKPDEYKPWLRLYCKFMLEKIAKKAAKIITISEYSRNDMIKTFSLPEDKVRVTHCGVNQRFRIINNNDLKEGVRKKYNLKQRFILYVGAIHPRKNILSLLRAYLLANKAHQLDFDLVLAGHAGWKNKEVFDLVNSLGIKDKVRFLGYVPDDDLPVIYNLAEFFIYPTFFEGFGMPVIEAMSCGCPVIASGTSSLPEVAGGAALLIDPGNIQQLADAISMLAKNAKLAHELREKGLKQAGKFSWASCAENTLKIYEEASR